MHGIEEEKFVKASLFNKMEISAFATFLSY